MPYDFGDDAVHERIKQRFPNLERDAHNFWRTLFIIGLLIYYIVG